MAQRKKSSGLTPNVTKVNRSPLKPAGRTQPPKQAPRILGGIRPGVSLSRAGAAVVKPEHNTDQPPEE